MTTAEAVLELVSLMLRNKQNAQSYQQRYATQAVYDVLLDGRADTRKVVYGAYETKRLLLGLRVVRVMRPVGPGQQRNDAKRADVERALQLYSEICFPLENPVQWAAQTIFKLVHQGWINEVGLDMLRFTNAGYKASRGTEAEIRMEVSEQPTSSNAQPEQGEEKHSDEEE